MGALVVAILLAVLTSAAIALAADDSADAGDRVGDLSAPSFEPDGQELEARRTANSQTFLLPDGVRETRIYETLINYRDAAGDWKPIDEELSELPSGAVTNGDNSFDINLPRDLDEAPARVTFGEAWVSEIPLGLQMSTADLQQNGTASYSAAEAGADFEFKGLANGLKESIELTGPAASSTYRFQIDASSGLEPALEQDGSIAFSDETAKVVAEMPAPFMVDNAGDEAPAAAVRYDLEDAGSGSWKLTVEADPDWLNAEDRSWPVVIDPSVTIPSPALDCVIIGNWGGETTRCGTTQTAVANNVQYLPSGADPVVRSLLRFDTSSIPKTADLTSATIGLYSAKTATNVTKVDVYDVSRTWGPRPNWLHYDYDGHNNVKLWTTPGGDYGKYMPAPTSLTPAERGGSGSGWWNFSSPDLTWLVQRWSEGGIINNGVLLKFADETPHICCFERLVEWESSSGANKPYLAVQYVLPASPDSKITSPSDGTKTAKRFLLTSAWEHSGVDGVTFQYKASRGWENIPASEVIDQNNQVVSWPYFVKAEERETKPLYWNASGRTAGLPAAKLQIRALLSGSPGAGGYTKPVSAEINRYLGGPKDAKAPVGPGSVDLLTGNFTISKTDFSIPAFGSALEFSRSFSSRDAGAEATGVLGPGWKPASPVEEAGGSSWGKLVLKEETEEFEEEGSFTYKWAELTHSAGGVLAFEDNGSGQYVTPRK